MVSFCSSIFRGNLLNFFAGLFQHPQQCDLLLQGVADQAMADFAFGGLVVVEELAQYGVDGGVRFARLDLHVDWCFELHALVETLGEIRNLVCLLLENTVDDGAVALKPLVHRPLRLLAGDIAELCPEGVEAVEFFTQLTLLFGDAFFKVALVGGRVAEYVLAGSRLSGGFNEAESARRSHRGDGGGRCENV